MECSCVLFRSAREDAEPEIGQRLIFVSEIIPEFELGPLPGTKFDFVKDLGIDDEPLPDLRLSIFTGPNSKLRLGYTHAAFEGDTIIGRTIQFNGTDYPASTRVVSELDLHYLRLGWIWQLPVIPGNCQRSEEHTSELQSLAYLVCRLLLEKKKTKKRRLLRDT